MNPIIDAANRLDVGPAVQYMILFTGFVIKPLYMLLTLVLIIMVRKNKSHFMSLIRWGLISFLAGEAFCAINYLAAGGQSDTLEILHGLGMVGLSILLPWGLYILADLKVLRFSDESANCSLIRLCGHCWKKEEVTCKLKQLFFFAAPCLALVALMPLAFPLDASYYIIPVFGVDTGFIFTPVVLWTELRLYPLLAAVLLLSSLLFLRGGMAGIKRAYAPFFTGLGFMLYSMFRFFLLAAFQNLPYWYNFWEEITELMMIAGIGLFLFLFRKRLNE